MDGEEHRESAVAAACEGLGVDLVDCEFVRGTLRITIAADDLDLDRVALVSRAVGDLLDGDEGIAPPSPYELEVSSPGLERRLRIPRHFAQVVGERIAVRTRPGTPGDRRFEGRLVAAGDDGITVDGVDGIVAYSVIDRAHTVFDWQSALAADNRDRARASRSRAASERTGRPRAHRVAREPSRETR